MTRPLLSPKPLPAPRPPLALVRIRARHIDGGRPLPLALEAALRADPRPGACAILAAVERRRRANRAEGQRLRHMLRHETALWGLGVERIAGIDEAGMSPLAGPVAAAAVVLARGSRFPVVDDSKMLDGATRERLAPIIRARAVAWAVAFVEPDEIDRLNIYWAGLLAMRRALEALAPAAEYALIDGRKLPALGVPQRRIFHGDAESLSIAAASILAKTARDARMRALDDTYPGYGFARHKGYPVPSHFRALARLGACPIHRRSFAPVREALRRPD